MNENKLVEINEEDIRNFIYIIRGKQVMLSEDIARLYQVETKKLNQAYKITILQNDLIYVNI